MIRRASEQSVEVRENMRGGDGRVTVRHFFKKEEFAAQARLCAHLLLPPGASIGPHQHEGEDEVYIVLRGSGILDDGVTQARVSAGDSILTGRGESHAVRNDGSEPLEMIAVIISYPAVKP
jgi:mannose-6-phosphate isomerase-like protein (cupin superfamily)